MYDFEPDPFRVVKEYLIAGGLIAAIFALLWVADYVLKLWG